jgi:hypothetical protein
MNETGITPTTIALSVKLIDDKELQISTLIGDRTISIQKYIVDQMDKIILDAISTNQLILLQARISEELLSREHKKE